MTESTFRDGARMRHDCGAQASRSAGAVDADVHKLPSKQEKSITDLPQRVGALIAREAWRPGESRISGATSPEPEEIERKAENDYRA